MMTRMPDLSRRAVLRLGAGAAVGAVGAYGLDILLQPRASQAMPAAGTGTPLAPPPPAPGPPRDPAPPAAAARPRGSDDALDLGRTVLPVLVKSYWKPVLAALVVVAVIIWLIVR